MFLLKKIKIVDQGITLLDTCLVDNQDQSVDCLFSTLILGENGVGKSFLLKAIADIFIYLNNAQTFKRKPKYPYDQFFVEYSIDSTDYYVERISSRIINCYMNGETIQLNELTLPEKVLAVAFMVNDKFLFAKRDEYERYVYLGVRKTTNATYTSSVFQNVISGIMRILKLGYTEELGLILDMLKFDHVIELSDYHGSVIARIDTNTAKIVEGQIPTSEAVVHRLDFYKKGRKTSYEECSSGEKHIIFTLFSVLSAIEKNSVILIDEPEISLHPEWQTQYISLLKHVFMSFAGCHILLASHSHYFVSDLERNSSSIVILKQDEDHDFFVKSELLPDDTYAWSAENIIYNVFGLRTTRNYYFESDLQKLISLMQESDLDKLHQVIVLVDKLKRYVYNEMDPLNTVITTAEDYIRCLQGNLNN